MQPIDHMETTTVKMDNFLDVALNFLVILSVNCIYCRSHISLKDLTVYTGISRHFKNTVTSTEISILPNFILQVLLKQLPTLIFLSSCKDPQIGVLTNCAGLFLADF